MEREKDIGTKVYDFLGRFIRYPNDHCRVIHTLWIIHTHLIDAFFTTPRLFILSAERRCGKSTLNRINKLLSQNANSWVNPSPASVYRFVDLQKAQRPTLQIDELDRMYQRGETADMTTLIDSGFQRGDTIPRAEKDKKGQWSIKTYECFSPLLLLGIDNGYYPDTVLDRSIPIRLKRMLANETVEPYRFRKIGPQAAALKEEVAAWAKTVLEKAGDLEPTMPEEIRQRDADKWEPLFIVARLLDRQNVTADTDGTAVTDIPGWWETKAREAALATLKEDREAEPASYRE
ncbi:MAG TPA: DUF3631 domain-containing protein, partial [Bacteroidia bacterium]